MDRDAILLEPHMEILICVQGTGKYFLVEHMQVGASFDFALGEGGSRHAAQPVSKNKACYSLFMYVNK
jgi:hypothetical protein